VLRAYLSLSLIVSLSLICSLSLSISLIWSFSLSLSRGLSHTVSLWYLSLSLIWISVSHSGRQLCFARIAHAPAYPMTHTHNDTANPYDTHPHNDTAHPYDTHTYCARTRAPTQRNCGCACSRKHAPAHPHMYVRTPSHQRGHIDAKTHDDP
jgi:hypothetical protein